MSVQTVLAEMEQRGLTLEVEDGRLFYSPKDGMPPSLLEGLREHKQELLEQLRVQEESFPDSAAEEKVAEEPIDWFEYLPNDHRVYLEGPQYKQEQCRQCGQWAIHHADCLALDPKGPLSIRFGKHKGKTVWQVPADYLVWCLETSNVKLTEELQAEMLRCLYQQPEILNVTIEGEVLLL